MRVGRSKLAAPLLMARRTLREAVGPLGTVLIGTTPRRLLTVCRTAAVPLAAPIEREGAHGATRRLNCNDNEGRLAEASCTNVTAFLHGRNLHTSHW